MTLGRLPRTLDICGTEYEIRSDFRSVLRIIAAFHDDGLTDRDKAYVLLKQLYPAFSRMPEQHIKPAYEKAVWFIRCGQKESKRTPQVVDWEKDEPLLFSAINRIAGTEVRLTEYLHWWTFMGFFQGIGHDDTYGYILMLRQKRMKGKPLEKWEKEFWNANRDLCEIRPRKRGDDMKNIMQELFDSLRKGG